MRDRTNRFFLGRFICTSMTVAAVSIPWSGFAEIEFNRDVRPILSKYCFHCHGPDSHSREANLRLDTREGAIADNDGVKAIDPGNLETSELIARIMTNDPDDVMPPPSTKKKLSPKEIDVLKKWVASGAEYQEHWAFIPPVKAKPPKKLLDRWSKNEIDKFVLERLKRDGLKPQKEADKARLLRRVTI